jgi:hypothetical protein
MQTVDVDCQRQPCCSWQSVCVASAVQAVSVPLHGVAVDDQLQPGVVQFAWLWPPHEAIVPVQTPVVYEQPWFEQLVWLFASCAQGVIVPVHDAVQTQPLVQVTCVE